MKTVGLIAEYDPFHNGHKYHIEEAKRVSGAERAVVVMSASFVQRGEPACADKFTRAEWALEGGADMVIELPDLFSVSCAERFASGAVRILNGTGIVDSICFGSETGDTEALKRIALSEPDERLLSEKLGEGLPYPKALAEASGIKLGPNDILGAEYIRAASKYAPGMEVFSIQRMGSRYDDSELAEELSSASAIRHALKNYYGETKMSPAVFDALSRALPRHVLNSISELMRTGSFPASLGELSEAALYRIRASSSEELSKLPEVSEGVENLFVRFASSADDIEGMLAGVKSKRYTMARLKRIVCCSLLGITKELQDEAAVNDEALYARVLGVKKEASFLLEMLNSARIPVIVRSSDREKLPPLAGRSEQISALAHRVRALGQPYDKSVEQDASHRLIVR
ncbi:MAG: nucleotidyltransferase family protein [Clostridia bacterium]|nr:nucleotidyltransferase family protein [Clostridia bacterium]